MQYGYVLMELCSYGIHSLYIHKNKNVCQKKKEKLKVNSFIALLQPHCKTKNRTQRQAWVAGKGTVKVAVTTQLL